MRLLVAGFLAALIASSLQAAPAASPSPQILPPKTVSPLVVLGTRDPPKIVSSFPAQGQVVAPGALVVRITFDQPMDEKSFSFTAAPSKQMPACLKTPRLLNDEKTFVLLCTTAPKTDYDVAFNAPAQNGFENIGGVRAPPARLAFSTNDDDGPRDLDDALKIAKLTRADVPIATQP